MEERRILTRRAADREIKKKLKEAEGGGDEKSPKERQRRRAIRHSCKAVIEVDVQHAQGGSGEMRSHMQRLPARVLDLSEGGAAFFLQHPLAHGDKYKATIKTYEDARIVAMVEARWTQHKEQKGGYIVGVKFAHIDPDSRGRLVKYLRDLDANAGLGADDSV